MLRSVFKAIFKGSQVEVKVPGRYSKIIFRDLLAVRTYKSPGCHIALENDVKVVSVNEEFLTGEAVASALGVSHRTLYRWHRLRKGPPQIKIGRKVYYRAEALSVWLRGLEIVATGCNGAS